MDKQTESRVRQEFEAWMACRFTFEPRPNFDRNIYNQERYVSFNTQRCWEAWTASRESLVIELPETHAHLIWIQAGRGPDDYWDDVEISRSEEDRCCDGSERYEVYAKWQVEELFRAIGIRIKGERV